ncbi:MAG: hypothetical protein GX352_08120 [Clostridiales bacterium]|nr:hypothetical protein [Clostridiales bacterium]
MAEAIGVLSKVLPVIFIIILGGFLRRARFIKQETINGLKRIVVNIALPSVLFLTFAKTTFEKRYILILFSVFGICGLMLSIGAAIKRTVKGTDKYFPALFGGLEAGMMGYPLFTSVYGSLNTYKLAIFDIGQVTFCFFVLVSYIQRLNGKTSTAKELTFSFVKSPVILSILLGITASFMGNLKIGPSAIVYSLSETLRVLSELTLPLICLIIGYELKIDFRNIRKPFWTAVLRLALFMIIAYGFNEIVVDRVLNLDNSFKVALYTLFLLPPSFIIPIYMDEKQEESKQFILNTISIGIVLSLIAYMTLILIL